MKSWGGGGGGGGGGRELISLGGKLPLHSPGLIPGNVFVQIFSFPCVVWSTCTYVMRCLEALFRIAYMNPGTVFQDGWCEAFFVVLSPGKFV
jgi:hypothetical protein